MASERSIEQACHHLLRNLDDPRALAENELVAPIFRSSGTARPTRRNARQALASVRRLLRAAAGDLLAREGGPAEVRALRQHVILTRCDLMGEPHKRVAAECGLSMRQFYRERRAMIARLAELLMDRFSANGAEPACTVDVTALELARARSLRYSGYSDCAQVVLRSIMEGSDEPPTVAAAGCQLVSLLLDRYRFDDARDQLDALHAYLGRRGADDGAGLEMQRVALERRNLLWYSGEDLLSRRLDEAANPSIQRLAACGYRDAQEFAAQALTFSGRRLFAAGEFSRAGDCADAADAALAAPDQAPLDVRISLLTFFGVLLATTHGQRAPASATFLDATSLAVRHGLTELAVMAVLALSIDDRMRGDTALARARMHEIRPLAISIASPLNLAQVHLRMGELALEAGDPFEARDAAAAAEECIPAGSLFMMQLLLLKARACLALQDNTAARMLSERAVANAAAQQNGRAEGTALYLLARSLAALNARSGAIDAIEAAVQKLERYGDPLTLAAACRTGALLTGRGRYMRAADEAVRSLQSA